MVPINTSTRSLRPFEAKRPTQCNLRSDGLSTGVCATPLISVPAATRPLAAGNDALIDVARSTCSCSEEMAPSSLQAHDGESVLHAHVTELADRSPPCR